jgi:hypothetical protein
MGLAARTRWARPIGIVLLLVPAGCYVFVWGGGSSPQRVDLGPLNEITLRDGIRSLKPAFSDFEGMEAAPDSSWALREAPGLLEHLYWRGSRRRIVRIETFSDPFGASVAFAAAPREIMSRYDVSNTAHAWSGEGDERACVSRVWEGLVADVTIGNQGSGTYSSFVVVQKKNVLIVIREDSAPTRETMKDPIIRAIADALVESGYATRTPASP